MTFSRENINPETLAAPRGYQNGVKTSGGKLVFVAGQIGWDKNAQVVSDDFVAQFEQAFFNVLEVVKAAGGTSEHLTQMTIFVTDKKVYIEKAREVGQVWRKLAGKNYPSMALVEVKALLEDRAQVEIQAMAVVPE
jgi:enamine deaminase RidA (YjgF/YER057c/UK114 family)